MVLEQQLVRLEQHGTRASPDVVWAAGPPHILQREKTAFFCSSQCPGGVILKAFDVMTAWREEGRILAGGFHSPMEHDCLKILLRGPQPIIWMPARSITGMRLKPEVRIAFKNGRLLIVSPFNSNQKRTTAALAQQRNGLLATISDSVFVAHAAAGSRTMELCQKLGQQNKPILTIDDPANRPLMDLGAKPVLLGAVPTASVTIL